MNAPRHSISIHRAPGSAGKGSVGCLFSLLLLAIAALVGFKAGPSYFAFKSLEADVKTEVSRAGAHYFDDETVIKDILDLSRRNEIRLKREDIKIERFAGQLFIRIHYSVPIDLIVYQHDMSYDINASSFIGRL